MCNACYAFNNLILLLQDICSLRGCTYCIVIPDKWRYTGIQGLFSNMAQWDPLPTKLTTFGPLSSEEQPSSGFLSKLFRKTKGKS